MRKLYKYMCGVVVAFTLTSCATIVSGTKAEVLLDGCLNDTLTVQTNVETYSGVTLPQLVEVKRNHLEEPIVVSKADTVLYRVYPGKKLNGWVWGNLLGTGIIGVTDFLTGAAYQPAQNSYFLKEVATSGTEPIIVMPMKERTSITSYRHEIAGSLGFSGRIRSRDFDRCEDVVTKQMGYHREDRCGDIFDAIALGLRYYYHFNDTWAVGMHLGCVFDGDDYEYNGNHNHSGRILFRSPYLMPSVKWTWAHTGNCSFYSRGSFGIQRHHFYFRASPKHADYQRMDKKKWLPAYHVTVAGMEVGKHQFRFFSELGYGNDGVFHLGVSYHFGKGE